MDKTLSSLKAFQKATVKYIYKSMYGKANQRNRMLVADEVGLGKTMVAKGLIASILKDKTDNRSLRVVYICSNQGIALQNLKRLNVSDVKNDKVVQSTRLTYLALDDPRSVVNTKLTLISLTPHTSFKITSGGGSIYERIILFHILMRHPRFKKLESKLSDYLRLDVGEDNWTEHIYNKSLDSNYFFCKQHLRAEVVKQFCSSLSRENMPLANQIAKGIREGKRLERAAIGELRMCLARLCVKQLKPDLVILDEFQRFKFLLDTNSLSEDRKRSDMQLLAHELFSIDKLRVLLLSATPYKMYTIREENENGVDHYEEFKFILKFLFNETSIFNRFQSAWNKYSERLNELRAENVDEVLQIKKVVERHLSRVVCRTERAIVVDHGKDMLEAHYPELEIQQSDIMNFMTVDKIAQEVEKSSGKIQMPIEYAKSVPYPMSFLDGYSLKRAVVKEAILASSSGQTPIHEKNRKAWLSKINLNTYRDLKHPNSKLNFLINESLSNGGYRLLWVPPSLPYYELKGAFSGMKLFSKTLVFSSWVMVPKAVASMISYGSERLTIGGLPTPKKGLKPRFFDTGSNRKPRPRINFSTKGSGPDQRPLNMSNLNMLYPCATLASIQFRVNKDRPSVTLSEVSHEIEEGIQLLLETVNPQSFVHSKGVDERWYWVLPILLDSTKNPESRIDWSQTLPPESDSDDGINRHFTLLSELAQSQKAIHQLQLGQLPDSKDLTRVLALQCIGSPAVCALRGLMAFNNDDDLKLVDLLSHSVQIAMAFRALFNTSESIAILDLIYSGKGVYWENVLHYCSEGCLQSMLDEYMYLIVESEGLNQKSAAKKVNGITNVLSSTVRLRTVSVSVDTYNHFSTQLNPDKAKHDRSRFRCHYALGFGDHKEDGKAVVRADNVRESFNSPFRPFVLTTTSIGQEGLDFHYYCRKLIHWNLPSNPVDMEQREGRINRYKGLAIRQNIGKRYLKFLTDSEPRVWDELFELARKSEEEETELVPYWHVEPEDAHIERIVPLYPYSKDAAKLSALLKTISVYRLALGQPRQEEFIDHFLSKFSEEESREIYSKFVLNLCPLTR